MTIGEQIRSLRSPKKLSPRALEERVGLNSTCRSKNENTRLDFAGYPGEETILNPAEALGAGPDQRS